MIVSNNSLSFPFKILAIVSGVFGISGLIFSNNYWAILLIIIGLLPFVIINHIEVSNDKKTLCFYKSYFFVSKKLIKKIEIPNDFENIYYQKRCFMIRTFHPRNGNLSYIDRTNYRIIIGLKENSVSLNFSEYSIGYKIAKYLSDSLNCKLIENEKNTDTVMKEDNEYFIQHNKDATMNFKMIRSLTKKKSKKK